MNDLHVRIIKLEPLHVAASLGWGTQPEDQAWTTIMDWIKAQAPEIMGARPRFFGFNNPDPTPGSPNYGYEQWVTVEAGAHPTAQISIKDFPGGLYAVMRCSGIPNPVIWQKLVRWVEASKYRIAHHQWLEESLDPYKPLDELEFDLYLPVAE